MSRRQNDPEQSTLVMNHVISRHLTGARGLVTYKPGTSRYLGGKRKDLSCCTPQIDLVEKRAHDDSECTDSEYTHCSERAMNDKSGAVPHLTCHHVIGTGMTVR